MPSIAHDNALLPAQRSERFLRVFAWYVRRLVRKSFHATLIDPHSRSLLSSLNDEPRPVLVCMSHQGWWDPLFIVLLGTGLMPARRGFGAIDEAIFRRFGFMKRIGAFGINPESPASLAAMESYALGLFASQPKPSLWITPQGRFADPREHVVIRPGAAALAAAFARRHPDAAPPLRAVALAVEYTHWHEQRPFACVRAAEVAMPSDPDAMSSTTKWHRAIQTTMRENATILAASVIARRPEAFVNVFESQGSHAGGTAVNPVYDLWQRLRGKSARITPRESTHRVDEDRFAKAGGNA
jgi:1-acyl-sn-glycerol-3-phosphate acyltransferase